MSFVYSHMSVFLNSTLYLLNKAIFLSSSRGCPEFTVSLYSYMGGHPVFVEVLLMISQTVVNDGSRQCETEETGTSLATLCNTIQNTMHVEAQQAPSECLSYGQSHEGGHGAINS